jgi:hypothetical protein
MPIVDLRDIKNYNEFYLPNRLAMFIMVIVFSVCIVGVSVLQLSDWEPIYTVNRFQTIQTNFTSQYSLISEYQKLEAAKMQNILPSMNNHEFYQCVDYGSYIIPMRVNPITFLPQAIRRGNGDAWLIQKSATKDIGASQFCEFSIMQYGSNTIQCGLDMYDALGYGGYMNNGHWCTSARQKLYNLLKA